MREIGGYQLLRELPHGRGGQRFVAANPRPTGPDDEIVALTILDADRMQDAAYLNILNTEAGPATKFRHESSVRVLEVNRIADGVAIVVELVDGQPLSEILERTSARATRLGWEYFTWAGAQIAALLQVAHATPWAEGEVKGMYHGQLGPHDVYVTYDGSVKVNGIGLGRSRGRLPEADHRLPYRAPELYGGHKVDHLTDVYGLGILLHDAISGRTTFQRETAPGMRRAIVEGTVPPLHLDAPTIPPALATLLGTMMAKLPGERPSSIFEIERQLRSHLDHEDSYYASGLAEHMKILFRTSTAAPPPPPAVVLREPPPLSSPPDEAWVPEPAPPSLPDDGFVDELGIEALVEALSHRRAGVSNNTAPPSRDIGMAAHTPPPDRLAELSQNPAVVAPTVPGTPQQSNWSRPPHMPPPIRTAQPKPLLGDDDNNTDPGIIGPASVAPPPRPPPRNGSSANDAPPPRMPPRNGSASSPPPASLDSDDLDDLDLDIDVDDDPTPITPWSGPLEAPEIPRAARSDSRPDQKREDSDPELLGALDGGNSDDLDSLVDAIVASGSRPAHERDTPMPPDEPKEDFPDIPIEEPDSPSPWSSAQSTPEPAPSSPPTSQPDEPVGPLYSPGDVIGDRYEILGLLGEGGVSVVYRVLHRLLEKEFALKVMRPELTALPTAKERFQREAKSVSQLDHGNIARVTDFGYAADGRMYLVMELVDGPSHAAVLDETPVLDTKKALTITVQLLRGLRHAHERGIVHRDLKPDNIMIATRDGEEVPKILDFGIAKITDETSSGGRAITQAGTVFGTPRYMSPEQAAGEAIDERTDLYTIGVIMYQMLTGRLPFDGESTLQILSRVLTQPPPPMNLSDPTRDAGKAVEGLVLKALEKERDHRYASATEFIAAIEAVVREHGLK